LTASGKSAKFFNSLQVVKKQKAAMMCGLSKTVGIRESALSSAARTHSAGRFAASKHVIKFRIHVRDCAACPAAGQSPQRLLAWPSPTASN
jgi:hypothetical protein